MDTVEFNGSKYPSFQAEGNATQFAIPFAEKFCKGNGVDVGFGKKEWKFPGATGADITDDSNDYEAFHLPYHLDYVYSSHCLEHIPDWVGALEYWHQHLTPGGTIFLYLPHPEQEYWKPWNNRKHYHSLHSIDVMQCLLSLGLVNVFRSERDLNHSYMVVGEKAWTQ